MTRKVEKVAEGENERKCFSEFIKEELTGNGERCSRKRRVADDATAGEWIS